jgi:hypothetical protein
MGLLFLFGLFSLQFGLDDLPVRAVSLRHCILHFRLRFFRFILWLLGLHEWRRLFEILLGLGLELNW